MVGQSPKSAKQVKINNSLSCVDSTMCLCVNVFQINDDHDVRETTCFTNVDTVAIDNLSSKSLSTLSKTATVAEERDCRQIRRLSPFSRRFRRQSHFSATVAVFGDSVDRA